MRNDKRPKTKAETKKELKKQEEIFLSEFKETHPIKIKSFEEKKILSSKPIF